MMGQFLAFPVMSQIVATGFSFFLFTDDLWSRLLLRFESCVLLCLSRSGGVQDAPVSTPISAAAASRDHAVSYTHLTLPTIYSV